MRRMVLGVLASVTIAGGVILGGGGQVHAADAPLCGPPEAELPATIVGAGYITGTEGDDVIVGSPRRDTILGLGGNDVICGLGGNDVIDGGDGDDIVIGGGADEFPPPHAATATSCSAATATMSWPGWRATTSCSVRTATTT